MIEDVDEDGLVAFSLGHLYKFVRPTRAHRHRNGYGTGMGMLGMTTLTEPSKLVMDEDGNHLMDERNRLKITHHYEQWSLDVGV